jgi:pimeloyl-CoA synthetase
VPEVFYQNEVNRLSQTTKELEIAVALAGSKVGSTEALLQQVVTKLDFLSTKIHDLEDNIVTKNNLEVAVNVTLNKHAAKVFWAILTVGIGTLLAWIGSLFK